MKKEIRALVILAHPDDETIWMGGTILRNKDWIWTIFSLCRKDDINRASKFKKVCSYYRAHSVISDLDDELLEPLSSDYLTKKIKRNLPKAYYNYIFTHGENGEYGHLRHKEIHKTVKNLVASGELSCENLYFLSYELGSESVPLIPELRIPVPVSNPNFSIELKDSEFKQKLHIVTNIYKFSQDSFEVLSCNKKEAFVKH